PYSALGPQSPLIIIIFTCIRVGQAPWISPIPRMPTLTIEQTRTKLASSRLSLSLLVWKLEWQICPCHGNDFHSYTLGVDDTSSH
ncbi:hypothetical protein Moror_13717, partial [Moniliophthora roreri MCA 2997]